MLCAAGLDHDAVFVDRLLGAPRRCVVELWRWVRARASLSLASAIQRPIWWVVHVVWLFYLIVLVFSFADVRCEFADRREQHFCDRPGVSVGLNTTVSIAPLITATDTRTPRVAGPRPRNASTVDRLANLSGAEIRRPFRGLSSFDSSAWTDVMRIDDREENVELTMIDDGWRLTVVDNRHRQLMTSLGLMRLVVIDHGLYNMPALVISWNEFLGHELEKAPRPGTRRDVLIRSAKARVRFTRLAAVKPMYCARDLENTRFVKLRGFVRGLLNPGRDTSFTFNDYKVRVIDRERGVSHGYISRTALYNAQLDLFSKYVVIAGRRVADGRLSEHDINPTSRFVDNDDDEATIVADAVADAAADAAADADTHADHVREFDETDYT